MATPRSLDTQLTKPFAGPLEFRQLQAAALSQGFGSACKLYGRANGNKVLEGETGPAAIGLSVRGASEPEQAPQLGVVDALQPEDPNDLGRVEVRAVGRPACRRLPCGVRCASSHARGEEQNYHSEE